MFHVLLTARDKKRGGMVNCNVYEEESSKFPFWDILDVDGAASLQLNSTWCLYTCFYVTIWRLVESQRVVLRMDHLRTNGCYTRLFGNLNKSPCAAADRKTNSNFLVSF